ncbi:hypothetical protein AVEN_157703-1 [Araneus ventricosus]|uniref:Uncharacterized protein n=1 Tax=Araneus ventricosus TaxID=182803 RepID=A0A4Y2TJW6_ARAVE|nr:hypothetical protein AVEN_157703-1 [Araneus ventricosus]
MDEDVNSKQIVFPCYKQTFGRQTIRTLPIPIQCGIVRYFRRSLKQNLRYHCHRNGPNQFQWFYSGAQNGDGRIYGAPDSLWFNLRTTSKIFRNLRNVRPHQFLKKLRTVWIQLTCF